MHLALSLLFCFFSFWFVSKKVKNEWKRTRNGFLSMRSKSQEQKRTTKKTKEGDTHYLHVFSRFTRTFIFGYFSNDIKRWGESERQENECCKCRERRKTTHRLDWGSQHAEFDVQASMRGFSRFARRLLADAQQILFWLLFLLDRQFDCKSHIDWRTLFCAYVALEGS